MSAKTKQPSRSKSKEYRAKPVAWREAQHYQFEFEKWLKENVSKQTAGAFGNILLLEMFKNNGIGPNGHTTVRRARNALKKLLPKFKEEGG